MSNIGSVIGVLVVVLAILFGIFMLMREVMCWYWKINQMVSLLQSIDNKLSTNSSNTDPALAQIIKTHTASSVKAKKCSKCGKEYASDFAGEFCEECGTRL